MIPQHTIDEIRDRAADDIVEIIEGYIPLKRSGNSYKAKCPFHDENTASFSVSPEKGIYKCFGCGEGGDGIDFLIKHEGLEFIEAVRQLADELHISIDEKNGTVPDNYTPPGKLIPGINEFKRYIRKEGSANVCFNKKEAHELQSSAEMNTLFLPHFRPAQARLIAKYTADIILYPTGLNRHQFFIAIELLHKFQLRVQITKHPGAPTLHWLKFIITHFEPRPPVRRWCIRLISAFQNAVTREIETQYFSENWID
jgi:hypothetical protein